MSPLLWDGEPPKGDNNDGVLAFVILTLVMWLVVILGMMFR